MRRHQEGRHGRALTRASGSQAKRGGGTRIGNEGSGEARASQGDGGGTR